MEKGLGMSRNNQGGTLKPTSGMQLGSTRAHWADFMSIFGIFCSYYPWCHSSESVPWRPQRTSRWILGSIITPVIMQSWLIFPLPGFEGTYASEKESVGNPVWDYPWISYKTQIPWIISSLPTILRAGRTFIYSVASVLEEAETRKASASISNPVILERVNQRANSERPRHPRLEQDSQPASPPALLILSPAKARTLRSPVNLFLPLNAQMQAIPKACLSALISNPTSWSSLPLLYFGPPLIWT